MTKSQEKSLKIRLLAGSDSIEELTGLLHRAYSRMLKQGFNVTGAYQSPEVTRERNANGECWVAELKGQIVGTILILPPGKLTVHPAYAQPGVAAIGQFAIEPAYQGHGYGAELLNFAERRAAALGARQVMLDTAVDAVRLVQWYQKKGYQIIDQVRWKGKTYQSVLLASKLV